jgi:peroxiredoxin Q/BCP
MPELQPGDNAPAFMLPDQSGGAVSVADFKGRKVLVFFYPKADTPG